MKTPTIDTLTAQALAAHDRFTRQWDDFTASPELSVDADRAADVLGRLEEKLRDNYPFFHPRYAGQMLKPPHPIAMAAYLMAMQINPNNHALDGGPATAAMEFDVVRRIAAMFGLETHLGHLTSSGTIANLEALWVARSLHPEKAIAFTADAHYTHRRMCEVIGVRSVELPSFDGLEEAIRKHDIGTIVVTIGTTSTGTVEPLHEVLPVATANGVRIHADAAYGGFFMLLAGGDRPLVDPRPFQVLRHADSIVVDPHKHGLQPYGCGCVLFRDPAVGRLYRHDSPYTYFTSRELHLGEISLECSRPGAAAAALWATLECFPLQQQSGLGPILAKTRHAAIDVSRRLQNSERFAEYKTPDLDIVTYLPRCAPFSSSKVSSISSQIFRYCMDKKEQPLYLATLMADAASIQKAHPEFIADADDTLVLRSVLMKPEHAQFVPEFMDELEAAGQKFL